MNALGVIGGMGPLATADFLKKLTVNTVATCDQAHLPVMVYGDCMVPDRTECVTRGGASPLPSLLRAVKSLCLLEVKALAIPCNMAHHWIGELAQVANVPFINMIDATIRAVENNNAHTKRVGVLSTAGLGLRLFTVLQQTCSSCATGKVIGETGWFRYPIKQYGAE